MLGLCSLGGNFPNILFQIIPPGKIMLNQVEDGLDEGINILNCQTNEESNKKLWKHWMLFSDSKFFSPVDVQLSRENGSIKSRCLKFNQSSAVPNLIYWRQIPKIGFPEWLGSFPKWLVRVNCSLLFVVLS